MIGVRVLFFGVIGIVHGSTYFPISLEHLSDISRLRELVKNYLTDDYMVEDVYLARWLQETNYNISEAKTLLKQNLQWRKKEKINTILDENWEEMHVRFPYSRETKDKSGKPLLYFNMKDWNIAKYFYEKESASDRLARYFIKMMEESDGHVRRLRAEGQSVAQFNLIINVGDWSLEKHTCIQCFQFYRNIGQILAPHFPYSTDKIIFVNSPFLFKTVYDYLIDKNQIAIEVFGQDQEKLKLELLEFIDRDQIPGGLLNQDLSKKDNSEGFMNWYKKEL